MSVSKPSKRWGWPLRAALTLVGSCLLATGVARVYGVRFALFPTWVLPKDPARPLLDHGEVWTLDSDGGAVEAFYFPAGPRAPAVILTHGNAEPLQPA